MGFSRILLRLRGRFRVPGPLQKLSRLAPSVFASKRIAPGVRSSLLIGLSLLCGLVSIQILRTKFAAEWERTHRPSREVWRQILKANGFEEKNPPIETRRTLDEALTARDSRPSVCALNDFSWVAWIADAEKSTDLVAYRKAESGAVPQWRCVDPTWGAFSDISQALKIRILPRSSRAAVKFLDPRALNY